MKKVLNIGRLNKRVRFYELKRITDALGQEKQRLEFVCEKWTTVHPVRAYEKNEAEKAYRQDTVYQLTTRYCKEIRADMIAEYNNKKMLIKSVVNVEEQNIMLEIQCEAYEERIDNSWQMKI